MIFPPISFIYCVFVGPFFDIMYPFVFRTCIAFVFIAYEFTQQIRNREIDNETKSKRASQIHILYRFWFPFSSENWSFIRKLHPHFFHLFFTLAHKLVQDFPLQFPAIYIRMIPFYFNFFFELHVCDLFASIPMLYGVGVL